MTRSALAGAALWLVLLLACGGPETERVVLGGEPFELELALDRDTRQKGLGGRSHIASDGGMLFAFPRPRPLGMVMRDCLVPIDVAFLDPTGRVIEIHSMKVEPPRRPGESQGAYEARLPLYPSGDVAQYAIETAGGRLAEVGLEVGDRIDLDTASLAVRTF